MDMDRAYLLPADDGAGLALDDHVLGGAEEEAGRGQEPWLVEVLHDVGHLLRLELDEHSQITRVTGISSAIGAN
jgi:hypothetical protein